MAASSPTQSIKFSESLGANAALNGNIKSISFETPKINLRGLNKPKCNKCGNVARSRCPFQSCKSCCAKAQNPCPIHVLKQNGTLPDKPATSTIPSFELQSIDASSGGASWRLTSLRQLSSTVVNTLRAKKAPTRKDAINLNNWRFSKLREHINGDIEAENEAFERYLQNVSLLEETFSTGETEENKELVTSLKEKLQSNLKREGSIKKRTRRIVNAKLKKLQEDEVSVSITDDELDAYHRLKKPKKLNEDRTAKTLEMDDLIEKLNKAQNNDDLVSCLEIKNRLFDRAESQTDKDQPVTDGGTFDPSFSPPTLCKVIPINPNDISEIDGWISSVSKLLEM